MRATVGFMSCSAGQSSRSCCVWQTMSTCTWSPIESTPTNEGAEISTSLSGGTSRLVLGRSGGVGGLPHERVCRHVGSHQIRPNAADVCGQDPHTRATDPQHSATMRLEFCDSAHHVV